MIATILSSACRATIAPGLVGRQPSEAEVVTCLPLLRGNRPERPAIRMHFRKGSAAIAQATRQGRRHSRSPGACVGSTTAVRKVRVQCRQTRQCELCDVVAR